ncbi:MAG: rhodanese-like domain-containing protein [Nitrolancea sp.]
MPTNIDRDQVRQLAREGATVIEVLPKAQYDKAHIAGAISIPLAVLGKQTPKHFQLDQPVVVYCYDRQ